MRNNDVDTFGDKPQCLSLGNQSRSAEGGKEFKGLVALSVNTEDTPHRTGIYRKQAPMLVIGVYECIDMKFIQPIHGFHGILISVLSVVLICVVPDFCCVSKREIRVIRGSFLT